MTAFANVQWWDCTDEEYYRSERHGSTSMARALGATPPKKRTGDMGRARHLAVFQPDLLQDAIAVMPESVMVGSGKGQRARLAEWQAENEGKIWLSEKDHHDLVNLATAVSEHPKAGKLLRHGDAVFERALRFDDYETGIGCRAKIDAYACGRVCDLKTSSTPEKDIFESKSAGRYFYGLQAALYFDAVSDIVDATHFAWIVVSPMPPYQIGLYQVGESWMDIGRREYRAALTILNKRPNGNIPRWWSHRPLMANSPPKWVEERIQTLEAFAEDL